MRATSAPEPAPRVRGPRPPPVAKRTPAHAPNSSGRRAGRAALCCGVALISVLASVPAAILLSVASSPGAVSGLPAWRDVGVAAPIRRVPVPEHAPGLGGAAADTTSVRTPLPRGYAVASRVAVVRSGSATRRARVRTSPPPAVRVRPSPRATPATVQPTTGPAPAPPAVDPTAPLSLALSSVSVTRSAAAPPPPPPGPPLPPLLVIGIPSVRRPGDPAYLLRALAYVTGQLDGAGGVTAGGEPTPPLPLLRGNVSGAFPLRVRVLVINSSRNASARVAGAAAGGGPADHAVFAAACTRYCPPAPPDGSGGAPACATRTVLGHAAHALAAAPDVDGVPAATVTFVDNALGWAEPGARDGGSPNVPGWRVRQQTADVVALMRVANAVFGDAGGGDGGGGGSAGRYYMFMEDDFRLCPSGVAALGYLLRLADAVHAAPPWNVLRVSFGLNGAVLRLGPDAAALGDYLSAHAGRRPPDHLTVEWFAGETAASAATKAGRPHAAFRYNVLEHFGRASSLRGEESPLYAYCYDELNAAVVFDVEAFKAAECPDVDVWPCPPPVPGAPPRPRPPADFPALAARARADSVQDWRARGA